MEATIADETKSHTWTYEAVRPLPRPRRPWEKGMRVVGDCSKGVQWLAWWADAPDPMGNAFGAYGNSATICMHLQHLVAPADLDVGDAVTFGPGGSDHATMVMEAGSDPLLWSFGHQGAPNAYRLSQDGREAQYLLLPVPTFVSPAVAHLRSETGYWAWVQWRLGEGDWHGRAKADPAVRPDVPALIPPGWWVALGRFLAARNKANKPSG